MIGETQIRNAIADKAQGIIDKFRVGKQHGREVSMLLCDMFETYNDMVNEFRRIKNED